MDFLPPSGGVFRLSHLGVIAGYPMQTVMRLSRFGAGFGNKKSPHNNLNLTIPSGVALVRVRYVAIRKSKTCSGSFGSRAGTLSKYVILNCWNRLPQKTSFVNKKIREYVAFGRMQENASKTLAKRERAGQCQPSCGSQLRYNSANICMNADRLLLDLRRANGLSLIDAGVECIWIFSGHLPERILDDDRGVVADTQF